MNSYILIGENHTGEFAFDFNNKKHIDELSKYINSRDKKITLWYEGDKSSISQSYKNFKDKLTKKIPKIILNESSWEKNAPLPKSKH